MSEESTDIFNSYLEANENPYQNLGFIEDKKGDKYILAFLARGDKETPIGTIANDSIPTHAKKWIGTDHVMSASMNGKHPFYLPPPENVKDIISIVNHYRSQAQNNKIGEYTEAFHITNKQGIHTALGIYKVTSPLYHDAVKKGIFPKYNSSSILPTKEENGKILQFEVIDNCSVIKPANGIEVAKTFLECDGGPSCITELKVNADGLVQFSDEKKEEISNVSCNCIDEALRLNKDYMADTNNSLIKTLLIQFMANEDSKTSNNESVKQTGAGQVIVNENKTFTLPGEKVKNESEEKKTSKVQESKVEAKEQDTAELELETQADTILKANDKTAIKALLENQKNMQSQIDKLNLKERRSEIKNALTELGGNIFDKSTIEKETERYMKDFPRSSTEEVLALIKERFNTAEILNESRSKPKQFGIDDEDTTSIFETAKKNPLKQFSGETKELPAMDDV